jgi:hypothetical protein
MWTGRFLTLVDMGKTLGFILFSNIFSSFALMFQIPSKPYMAEADGVGASQLQGRASCAPSEELGCQGVSELLLFFLPLSSHHVT